MKLVPMRCSACGATLHFDEKRGIAHCPHCGTLYVVDDERSRISLDNGYTFGYDFERGRMKAQDGKDSPDGSSQKEGTRGPQERQQTIPFTASHGKKTLPNGASMPKHGCLWLTLGLFLILVLPTMVKGTDPSTTSSSRTATASSTTSSTSSASSSVSSTTSSASKSGVTKPDDSHKRKTTDATPKDTETTSVSPEPAPATPKITRDDVRTLYDEACEVFNTDIEQHGNNEALSAYDTAVEGLWTLSLDDAITESDLAEVQSGIGSARSSYLDAAEQIEHEAARKQAEQERAEQERIAKEQAEQQRIANIQASYVDPEVLLTVEGTLAHRSRALDLESNDLMKYFPTDTGAEEYFDAFNDWITLHEHYEFTKEYSEGPVVVKPGDMFYVSDQEMADATAHLRDLRRNMVVAYEIEHPEG